MDIPAVQDWPIERLALLTAASAAPVAATVVRSHKEAHLETLRQVLATPRLEHSEVGRILAYVGDGLDDHIIAHAR